jgi:hypothetical protein
MHQSSESIGAIAAALAKAQAELTNPEKSLTATIAIAGPPGGDRRFRYAPLSSGLDIVRKSLGRHEIATVQTTSIDPDAGLVRLTTLLAHASGEWVSSEWPVCPISDTASPQRMGAALTYARRYALFTLVGIAGEDDLDAPDLAPTSASTPGPNGGSGRNDDYASAAGPVRRGHGKSPSLMLAPEASGVLRAQMLVELDALATAEAAVEWARGSLAAKNTLLVTDARVIEDAFLAKITAFGVDPEQPGAGIESPARTTKPESTASGADVAASESATDHAVRDCSLLPKQRRLRDKRHRQFVAAQPCIICGQSPCDAHHLRFAQPRALGRRVSDEFTVPLCRMHHRELHRSGNELKWWKDAGTAAIAVARNLWVKPK